MSLLGIVIGHESQTATDNVRIELQLTLHRSDHMLRRIEVALDLAHVVDGCHFYSSQDFPYLLVGDIEHIMIMRLRHHHHRSRGPDKNQSADERHRHQHHQNDLFGQSDGE